MKSQCIRSAFAMIVQMLFALPLCAQNVHYLELSANPAVKLNEKWNVEVSTGWKHLFEEPDWSRANVGGTFYYTYNSWRLISGYNMFYTYQQHFENYLELRPFVGIMLTTPVIKPLQFRQRYLLEWRNLLYKDNTSNESMIRGRYKMELIYAVFKNEQRQKEIAILGSIEAYMISVSGKKERYASSWEYTIKPRYTYSDRTEITIGYTLERLSQLLETNTERGNTFFLELKVNFEKK
jgi:hypothetical protein